MSEDSNRGAGPGANATGGSARPSGKRQVSGEASTARAMASSAPEPQETPSRRGPVKATAQYVGSVSSEVRKVIWPTGREMVNYSIVVLVFLILTVALVSGVDYLTSLGVRWVFGV